MKLYEDPRHIHISVIYRHKYEIIRGSSWYPQDPAVPHRHTHMKLCNDPADPQDENEKSVLL